MAYRFRSRSNTPGAYRLAPTVLSQLVALGDIRLGVGRGDGGIGTLLVAGGTSTDPGVGNVESGVSYMINDEPLVGTFAVPSTWNVKDGVHYGAGGTEFEGTYQLGVPVDPGVTTTYGAPTVIHGTSGQAATASLSIARPTSLRVGDLLVLCVATESSAIVVPAGFAPVVAEIAQGTLSARVWTKFAAHNEPATYTVSFAAAEDSLYNLFLVRGVSPFDVIDVTDSAYGNAGLPLAEPDVTTTVDNCLAVGLIVCDGSPRVIVQPTGWTLLDSDDGPAGSLSWAIAAKTIATAGVSGGATWSATDSTAGDYAAITLAITPGVMGLGDSIVYGPQRLLALTLADCTEFRNLVGATDHASAFARIWHESLPAPAGGAERYSLDELDEYRPYAMVFTADLEGATGMRQATGPGGWADRGVLRVQLEISTPEDLAHSPILVDHFIKQTIGRIIKRPPDESSATFVGLEDLAHTTNEVSGYSYLAADQVLFRGYHRSALVDQPKQGDCIYAWLELRYGEGGV